MYVNPNPWAWVGMVLLLLVAGVLLWLVSVLWEDAMYEARTGRRRWED